MIYGNILSTNVLGNMNIIKEKNVIQPPTSLKIGNGKTTYIDDFPAISKLNNHEVIQEYIKMVMEEIGVTLTMKDILEPPEGSAYKSSRKRKQLLLSLKRWFKSHLRGSLYISNKFKRRFKKWSPQPS